MKWVQFFSIIAGLALAVQTHASDINENFVWNSDNLNTLVAMGCAEKYSRVINQNDPSEFLLYNWSWSQHGDKTIVTGNCGQRFNSNYQIIPESSTDIEFTFDRAQWKAKDDVVIEGRIGGQGIKFYFNTRMALDENENLVSMKALNKVGIMNTYGLPTSSFFRSLIEPAINISEDLHGGPSYRGVWSSAQHSVSQLRGENDRFATTSGVFAARDQAGQHRILFRTSNLIRNQEMMSSVDDSAELVVSSEHYLPNTYKGCSYFNEQGIKKITFSQCATIWSRIRY